MWFISSPWVLVVWTGAQWLWLQSDFCLLFHQAAPVKVISHLHIVKSSGQSSALRCSSWNIFSIYPQMITPTPTFSSLDFQDTEPSWFSFLLIVRSLISLLVALHLPNLLILVVPRAQPLDLCSFSAPLIPMRNLIQSPRFKWHLPSEDPQDASTAQTTPPGFQAHLSLCFFKISTLTSNRCLNFPCQKLNSWPIHTNLIYS